MPNLKEPKPGTLWLFHDDPDRVYEVMFVTNTYHRVDHHPPQVVYQTHKNPDHKWSRSVGSFNEFFTQVLK